MRGRMCFVLALLSATAVLGAADTVSRVFTLRFVSVVEASAAVQPMLSDRGTMTLQPSQARMTVQDVPEVIDRVAKLIAELDHRPSRYRVEVELLEGGPERPFGTADDVEADERLRRMFKFPAYRRIGSAVLEGELGGLVQADLGSGFRVSFRAQVPAYSDDAPWGVADPGDRIHLRGLVLQRVRTSGDGELTSDQVLRTTVLLSPNQRVYIGAGGSEDAATGWVLIVQARDVGAH